MKLDLPEILEFDWNEGNLSHIKKHGFTYKECEEVFFSEPLYISEDRSHSQIELRYKVLGKTKKFRGVILVFTIRDRKVRVISTRDQNKNERKLYKSLGGEIK